VLLVAREMTPVWGDGRFTAEPPDCEGSPSTLLLLRLDVSDVGPVERVAVGPGRRKLLALCVPGPGIPNAPGSTPRRQVSVFGLFSLLFATIEAPCIGGRAPVPGAFAAAAVLQTAFVAWELRPSHPMLDPRFVRMPAFRHGVGQHHDYLLRGDT
jgi:hypothetical protein